jgi:hypothetical protein
VGEKDQCQGIGCIDRSYHADMLSLSRPLQSNDFHPRSVRLSPVTLRVFRQTAGFCLRIAVFWTAREPSLPRILFFAGPRAAIVLPLLKSAEIFSTVLAEDM